MPHTRSPDQSQESRKELKSEQSLDNLINGYNFKILSTNLIRKTNGSVPHKSSANTLHFHSQFAYDFKKNPR